MDETSLQTSLQTGETDDEKSLESKDEMMAMAKDVEQQLASSSETASSGAGKTGGDAANITSAVYRTVSSVDKVNDNNEEDAEQEKKKRTVKKHLHEPTLKAVETYLKKGDFLNEPLEYEEVAAFNLKIHRYTDEKTRMRQGLLSTKEGSKAEDVEQMLYNQVYQEEEFHAVGNEFFKDVLTEANDMAGSSFIMHTKTTSWLKKAAGLQRNYDPFSQETPSNLPLSDDSEDEVETTVGVDTSGAPRRVTRTRVRQSRRKRRQQKLEKETEGLRLLADMARELEKGQSKRLKAIERKNRQERAALLGDTAALDFIEGEEEQEDEEMRDADIPETAGQRQEKSVPPNTIFQRLFPNLDSMELLQLGSVNKYKDPVALGMLEWNEMDRLDRVTPKTRPLVPPPNTVVPPALNRLGLELRPRKLDLQEKSRSFEPLQGDEELPALYTSTAYDSTSETLMKALMNSANRNWAIREFFYSDIDREWHHKKDILFEIEKLGIPISSRTRLTRTEWSMIRRKIRRRPRRFSKRFIAEQIQKRNDHRRHMRQQQLDPEVLEKSTIPVGKHVTAYNKKYQTIRKGTVLLFDPMKFEYLIRFDGQEYGCEICPDSEVAALQDTSIGPGSCVERHPEFANALEDSTAALFSDGAVNENNPMFKKEMEREVLVTVLAVVKEAFDRKRAILIALELCGESNDPKKSKYVSWLLANLDRVNSSLQSGILHLQVMYGSAYATPPSLKAKLKYEAERKILPRNDLITDVALQEWMSSLDAASAKIGKAGTPGGKQEKGPSRLQRGILDSFNLLLLTNFLTAKADPPAANKALDAALQVATDAFAEHGLPSTSETELIGQQLEQESRIEEAMKELGEAVGVLRAEIAACNGLVN
jgi:hypothetical protein